MFATRNPLEPIEATELPPRGRAYGPSSIDSSSGKVKQTSAPGLRRCLRDLSTDFARIFVVFQLLGRFLLRDSATDMGEVGQHQWSCIKYANA
jgi:hypothetical protein